MGPMTQVWLTVGVISMGGIALGAPVIAVMAIFGGVVFSIFVGASYISDDPYQQKFQADPKPESRYIRKDSKNMVWERQQGECAHPGCHQRDFLQLHHIVPLSKGGSNEEGNLMYLCPNHHALVHGRNIDFRVMKDVSRLD